ncbi:M56 family metallopeptidase [Amnibacterium endophyticum]|uniref:M56 family metallopeptidase n=1 Tax=Amnibacterium endophyticum TaxID=2109337 RepID=A0ABW4LH35_9MICO
MLLASALLGLLAVALAWPVPLALARARWVDVAPVEALVLWQAIALAGVLSLIGALLTAGLAPYGDHLLQAASVLVQSVVVGALPSGASLLSLVGVSAALLLGAHLLLNLLVTGVQVQQQRQRHLDLLLLLSTPLPDVPRTRLLDTPAPVAYCLPGSAQRVTVLSAGLLELLAPEEVDAVVLHERAHLRQHHDVVLVAFRAWRVALPWFPVANRAQDAVGLLIEMVADDRARTTAATTTLAHAIGVVAAGTRGDTAPRPPALPAADPVSLQRRISRLEQPGRTLSPLFRYGVGAGAVGLVVVPTVLLLLPALLGE